MQQYTAHEAGADAPLVFLKHISQEGGEVTARPARLMKNQIGFEIDVRIEYPDGSWKAGTVYLFNGRAYALHIHSAREANEWVKFPFSWEHGHLEQPII